MNDTARKPASLLCLRRPANRAFAGDGSFDGTEKVGVITAPMVTTWGEKSGWKNRIP